MAPSYTLKLLEASRVCPPPASVTDTVLPLTFFDVFWLHRTPVQRLFFYQLPQNPNTTTTTFFKHSILPKLKHSLSLSLRLFFPLAGNLTHSPASSDHVICYTEGDSVPLTIFESDADFRRLIANHPRDVTDFHPLVPHLPPSDPLKQPLLALQLTIFPNSASVCIGTSIHHAVADGRSFIHFMKSWASICRNGNESSATSHPFYDRSVTVRLDGLKRLILDQLTNVRVENNLVASDVKARDNPVRATFVLTQPKIKRLRQRVLARVDKSRKPFHCSAFVLTCAYVWVCLVRARRDNDDDVRGTTVYFSFAVDCRARMDPPMPATYFGNCAGRCLVEANGGDLVNGDGVGPASEAIGRAIQALADGAFKGVESWVPKAISLLGERVMSVADSPKFRVYDTDFGFGKPKKVEVISIEETEAISLAESGDGEGGIEVGLALPKCEMESFASLFEEGQKVLLP